MNLSCYSCLHSIGSYPGSPLICTRTMQSAPLIPCEAFVFQPGTDEYERDPMPATHPQGGG